MSINGEQLKAILGEKLAGVQVVDMHTHLFSADFDEMLLWGIDEVLTYHYLIAEYFRYSPLDYGEFFQLPKEKQADEVWRTLFLERSPVSEAQRGVLTILKRLGLDVGSRSLEAYREYFRASQSGNRSIALQTSRRQGSGHDQRSLRSPGKGRLAAGVAGDPRFRSSLRIDPLLLDFPRRLRPCRLKDMPSPLIWGRFRGGSAQIPQGLDPQDQRLYLAASLPCSFDPAQDGLSTRVLKECILPVCGELDVPFALMIGVKRQVNPRLGLAGDSVGKAQIGAVERLCAEYPDNKFLVTMLSRENQHELAITARKYRNLMVFGCWWFLNNPSLVQEITAMRLETLGLSFIPQHSDARVLEHLIYKWDHSRAVISEVLWGKYRDLLATGWSVTEEDLERDLQQLFQGNFHEFVGR